MKTSAIMLDSTLSKILTTDPVEKLNQVEVEDVRKSTDTSARASSKAEAEVRIVVRFTVEEQVIYKGKVERIHQLESEELSRIVSRVAWDDANDGDEPPASTQVTCLYDQSATDPTDSTRSVDQHNRQESSTVSDRDTFKQIEKQQQERSIEKPPQDRSIDEHLQEEAIEKHPEDKSIDNKSQEKAIEDQPKERTNDESPENVQGNPNSNIESSDHIAYIRTSADPGSTSDRQDDTLTEPEVSSASEPLTPNQCDINLERFSNLTNEVRSPPIPDQDLDKQQQQESDERQLLSSSNDTNPEIDGSNQHCTDYPVENQTVTDTLNDCVNMVDIESRKETTITIPSSPQIPKVEKSPNFDEKSKYIEPLSSWLESKENEACKLNGLENNESATTSRRASSETSRESCITSEPERSNGNFTNGGATNNIIETRIPNEDNSILYKNDASGSNKRKNHTKSNNTSTKRIRRTTDKEQRNSKSRAVTNVENAGRRQSINTRCSNSSLLDNQQPRKNKIFAKWTDNHFYPGTILKLAKDRKYVVGFFDGAQRNVPETELIPLCNIEGKQVRVSIARDYCVNAIVHDQRSPVNDQPMFDVEYQQDGLVRKCVPLKDIFLTGEQGTPLIQTDRNSGASNFADVDLDNIIYQKRSRRFQDMEDFELTDNSSVSLSL